MRWLLNKLRLGASAILGDEMGLGKTVQTAVFVAGARAMGLLGDKPVLVAGAAVHGAQLDGRRCALRAARA